MKGLPPLLIQTRGNETLLTENIDLAKKAVQDGVEVTLTVYPGMPHDFALMLPDMEQSVNSLYEMKDFVNRYMK
ncbi:MAG: alpha/beta hydrolase [Acidaminococcaceae bacterium]|nr:alpha/beta hydrolase [Acidaminococcaceae bacterium]MBQ9635101.1 alpha/beta hydrolase [Acidaminococcaceae bacterium]MBR1590485.1 alpha/beta hydrolase [Acidaminococcaceae bacterium]